MKQEPVPSFHVSKKRSNYYKKDMDLRGSITPKRDVLNI